MPASIAIDPKHWRKRAEEARNLADKMNDPLSKEMMLQIAKDYEQLAERAEERAKIRPQDKVRPLPSRGRDYLNVQQRPKRSAPLLCQLFLPLAG